MIRNLSRKALAVGAILGTIALAAPAAANADALTGWVGPAGSNGSGVQFLNTSTIINAPSLIAQSKIYSVFGQSVAPGDIGVRARLFKSGVLCEAIDYKYNLRPSAELTIGTTKNCGTGSYNSHGFTAVWDGTSSYNEALTFPSSPLDYTAPAARTAREAAETTINSGTNGRGQSYGTGDSTEQTKLPDLIAAVGDDGTAGYVLNADLNAPLAGNPADAAALPVQDEGGAQVSGHNARTVALYSENGQTQVGEFTIG